MRNQLRALAVLALVLQGCAHAGYPADAETVVSPPTPPAESQDATWGIGERASMPQEPSLMSDAADLERAFWMCDYAATTRGVDATPVAICGAVYDELKNVKFSGDFLRLLDWWKQNKPMEHRRVALEERGAQSNDWTALAD